MNETMVSDYELLDHYQIPRGRRAIFAIDEFYSLVLRASASEPSLAAVLPLDGDLLCRPLCIGIRILGPL
jgi:hypothetical protein